MRKTMLAVCAVLLVMGCAPTTPVVKTAPAPPEPHRYGYRLSGSNVVFEFNADDYVDVTSSTAAVGGASSTKTKWSKLSDLRIHSVAVAGEFNRWSTTAWPMVITGSQWITAQPIANIDADRPLAFKFLVNSEFWVEPPATALNRAPTPGSKLANLMLELHHADAVPPAAPAPTKH